jgi:hypothetical protein
MSGPSLGDPSLVHTPHPKTTSPRSRFSQKKMFIANRVTKWKETITTS